MFPQNGMTLPWKAMFLEEFGDQNRKKLYSNSWCNSVDKGANEIFACFKRESKNRSGRSSLYKAFLKPVKKEYRFSVHIFKRIWRNGDVQKRDIGIIHKLKEILEVKRLGELSTFI